MYGPDDSCGMRRVRPHPLPADLSCHRARHRGCTARGQRHGLMSCWQATPSPSSRQTQHGSRSCQTRDVISRVMGPGGGAGPQATGGAMRPLHRHQATSRHGTGKKGKGRSATPPISRDGAPRWPRRRIDEHSSCRIEHMRLADGRFRRRGGMVWGMPTWTGVHGRGDSSPACMIVSTSISAQICRRWLGEVVQAGAPAVCAGNDLS